MVCLLFLLVEKITGYVGEVMSPGFPGVYPNNYEKHWRITVSSGYVSMYLIAWNNHTRDMAKWLVE